MVWLLASFHFVLAYATAGLNAFSCNQNIAQWMMLVGIATRLKTPLQSTQNLMLKSDYKPPSVSKIVRHLSRGAELDWHYGDFPYPACMRVFLTLAFFCLLSVNINMRSIDFKKHQLYLLQSLLPTIHSTKPCPSTPTTALCHWQW